MRKTLAVAVVAIFAMTAVLTATLSCGRGVQRAEKQTEADSLILPAQNAGDYERLIVIADSLEKTGDISPIRSAFLRGASYMLLNDLQRGQDVLTSAIALTPRNSEDSLYHVRSVLRMAELFGIEKNYGGLLHVALPAIEWMKDVTGSKESRARAELFSFVGYAQYALGMKKEAAKSFDQSYANWLDTYAADPTWQNIGNTGITAFNIVSPYLNDHDYAQVERWTLRHDSVFAVVTTREDVPTQITDKLLAQNKLLHALLALGKNRPEEAMSALDDFRKTEFSKSTTGKVMVGGTLLKAGRYDEAADQLACLDQYLAEQHQELSLDVINDFLRDKFLANYNSGRRDSALAVAVTIVENLDSAIAKQKASDAAELATIYETQQKDAEIAQQQISLSRQRLIGTLAVLVLLTTFFVIYTWYRRRAQQRLSVAHEQLKTAYDQLEETTAAKERIESELRIARNIQMSMVPSRFPEYEGLDMFAEMTPAKEVGGDLYGYVLLGEKLYFCVGDVSGKGVPASLFMSQATRLFRTLAAQGLMPAEICTRMNSALADGNSTRMFVTLFLGLLDLQTGHLDFCNCGHNAPVISDGDGHAAFIEMVPNLPIGVFSTFEYKGEEIDTIKGKTFFVYTDGLNEAENMAEEQFGNDRLLEIVRECGQQEARQVIERLVAEVEKHRAGAEPNDDLTLMCLKLVS